MSEEIETENKHQQPL